MASDYGVVAAIREQTQVLKEQNEKIITLLELQLHNSFPNTTIEELLNLSRIRKDEEKDRFNKMRKELILKEELRRKEIARKKDKERLDKEKTYLEKLNDDIDFIIQE